MTTIDIYNVAMCIFYCTLVVGWCWSVRNDGKDARPPS